jgi:hypothetical protein
MMRVLHNKIMAKCTAELNEFSPGWNIAKSLTTTGSRVVSRILWYSRVIGSQP